MDPTSWIPVTLTEFMSKQPRKVLVSAGLLLLAVVAAADWFIGRTMLEFPGFAAFYLIPISFFSWFLGRRIGTLTAILSGAIVLGLDLDRKRSTLAFWNTLVWVVLYFASAFIISQLTVLYQGERRLARVDSLTRIPNRRALFEFATRERARAERQHLPLSVAYIDVDRFKEINDLFGHSTGDKLLALVASVIERTLRPSDFVARMGGDEFAIFLPATQDSDASAVLNRVRHALDRAMGQRQWPVTFSIGLETFTGPWPAVDEMLSRADELMYAIKHDEKRGRATRRS